MLDQSKFESFVQIYFDSLFIQNVFFEYKYENIWNASIPKLKYMW
jgi:hypothetical protein